MIDPPGSSLFNKETPTPKSKTTFETWKTNDVTRTQKYESFYLHQFQKATLEILGAFRKMWESQSHGENGGTLGMEGP